MSAPTLPWSPDAEQFIRYAVRHDYSVRIYERGDLEPDPSRELPGIEVLSCTLTYDQNWTPYVQGQVTIVTPDAATLAKLDPRTLVAVEVYAGYVLADGTDDTHLMARAMLSNRVSDHADGTTQIEFQGLEYLFDADVNLYDMSGAQEYSSPGGWTPTTKVSDAVFDTLEICNAWTVTWSALGLVSDATGWVSQWESWHSRAGENRLGLLREIADRTGLWFRCDEFGTWTATSWPAGGGTVAHQLREGADGTIVEAQTGLSREGFTNAVFVRYAWTDAHVIAPGEPPAETVQREATGYAAIADGPYSPLAVGRVPLIEERRAPSSPEGAAQTAANILRRSWAHGDTLSVDAVAAYWLRAGHLVQILLAGETTAATYLIQRVTYDMDAGRMSIGIYEADSGTPPFTIE